VYGGDDRVTQPARSSTVASDRHRYHRVDAVQSVSSANNERRGAQDRPDHGGLVRLKTV
jgi:hypothetical protein